MFLETIHISEGRPLNIAAHQERFDATRRHFYGNIPAIKLDVCLQSLVAGTSERLRCSLVYDKHILRTELIPYVPRIIRTLKLVNVGEIDYSFKFSDRSMLTALFAQREEADEIIIVKNGFITDASYANLIFRKDGVWYTPSTPLLKGTKRGRLLAEGRIREAEILAENLGEYSEAGLINAMLDLGEIQIETKFIM